jgi:ATP-dependent Clp protease adaptor protein ClpS
VNATRGTLPGQLVRRCAGAGQPDADVQEIVVEEEANETSLAAPWFVVLFDDDVHTFNDVIFQLMKATGCTSEVAEVLAWRVHITGKARVFEGTFEACFRVLLVLMEIALLSEVQG